MNDRRVSMRSRTVDIIMPVYGNFDDAARAVASVLASRNDTPFDLIIIDDASPSGEARAYLSAASSHFAVKILRNDENLGFAATVNRGMAMHSDRDVILLNSDVLVFGNWLDRIVRVLRYKAHVATVTPLSNAATILSYPRTLVDNDDALDWSALDGLCATLAAEPVDIPTAIGFCMAIRRDCLDAIGDFDAATFGRGYGEENDFCLRASTAGWCNLAATDTFVWHRGGGSFGEARSDLSRRAQALIAERHPHYAADVRAFIAADPLRHVRRELDALRLRGPSGSRRLDLAANGDTQAGDIDVHLVKEMRGWRAESSAIGALPNLPVLTRYDSVATLRRWLTKHGIDAVSGETSRHLPASLRKNIIAAADSLRLPVT